MDGRADTEAHNARKNERKGNAADVQTNGRMDALTILTDACVEEQSNERSGDPTSGQTDQNIYSISSIPSIFKVLRSLGILSNPE